MHAYGYQAHNKQRYKSQSRSAAKRGKVNCGVSEKERNSFFFFVSKSLSIASQIEKKKKKK